MTPSIYRDRDSTCDCHIHGRIENHLHWITTGIRTELCDLTSGPDRGHRAESQWGIAELVEYHPVTICLQLADGVLRRACARWRPAGRCGQTQSRRDETAGRQGGKCRLLHRL